MTDPWIDGVLLVLALYALLFGDAGLGTALGLAIFLVRRPPPPSPPPSLPRGRVHFRYVTRGDDPDLIAHSVATVAPVVARSLPSQGYTIEVVSDRPVRVPCRLYVVPQDYQTPSGARFKARALHFALARSPARVDDWIVHLDEESVFDQACLWSMLRYMAEAEARGTAANRLGQGAVVYGGGRVGSPFVAAMDSVRVAWDLGLNRLASRLGLAVVVKGSFLVVSQQTERCLGWDLPPDLCLAEDSAALACCAAPLRGAWIEGVMCEGSPLSLRDLMRQRRRWLHGQRAVLGSRSVPLPGRANTFLMLFSMWEGIPFWLLVAAGLAGHTPGPWPLWLTGAAVGCQGLAHGTGAYFNDRDAPWRRLRRAALCALAAPLFTGLQALIWFWAMASSPGDRFEIVRKRPVSPVSGADGRRD